MEQRFRKWANFYPLLAGTLLLAGLLRTDGCSTFLPSEPWAYCLAFSPDGQTLAMGGGLITKENAELNGLIWQWNLNTGQAKKWAVPGRNINWIAFAPNGHQLASFDTNRVYTLWNLEKGQWIRQSSLRCPSHLNMYIAKFWLTSADLMHWDEQIKALQILQQTRGIWIGALSQSGQLAACFDKNGSLQIWNVPSRKLLRTLFKKSGDAPPQSMAFSPDGKALVVGMRWPDGYFRYRLWDVQTGKSKCDLLPPDGKTHLAVFSPDSSKVATYGYRGPVRIWDAKSGKLLRTLTLP